MRWWSGQYIAGSSLCQSPQTMGDAIVNYSIRVASDSYISVTMTGKCVLIDDSGVCSSYNQTYQFECVSIAENGPDDWVIRWEMDLFGETSWIEFHTATSGDIDSWSFEFKTKHFPHFTSGGTSICSSGGGGCVCADLPDNVCEPIPAGSIDSTGGHPGISANLSFYKLDEPFNPNDFCSGPDDACPEVPAFTCVECVVHNCDGSTTDPYGKDFGLGFRIDFSQCCVEH